MTRATQLGLRECGTVRRAEPTFRGRARFGRRQQSQLFRPRRCIGLRGTRLGPLCRSLGMRQRRSRDPQHCRVRRRRSGLDRHSPRRRCRVTMATSGEQESSRVDQTHDVFLVLAGPRAVCRVGIGRSLACGHRTYTRGYALLSFRRPRGSKSGAWFPVRGAGGASHPHRSIRRAALPELWRRSSLRSSSSAESSRISSSDWGSSLPARPSCRRGVRLASRRHPRDRLGS